VYWIKLTRHVSIVDLVKSVEFWSNCGRAKGFFSQSSKPNELILNTMFYDSVCLKGKHGQLIELIRILVFECDDFEDCDVTMTS